MTARLNDRELNRVLDAWLEEGPMAAADMTVDRVMARVPTVRQHGRVSGAWPRLLQPLRTQGPMLVSVMVLVTLVAGVALAIGMIMRPGPAPSPPLLPSSEATPALAESEAIIEEIRGPVPLRTFDSWVAKSRDPSLGEVRQPGSPSAGVHGYIFTPDSTGRWFTIYLDPTQDYGDGATTERDDLIGWNFSNILDPEQRGAGSFMSAGGECALTFHAFTQAEIAGTLACVDVPGTYSAGTDGSTQDAVIERLRATFSFHPVLDVYEQSVD
jgi:hypothetical protein